MDLILFHGLRRSGNHAIQQWVLQHFDGLSTLCNNVPKIDENILYRVTETQYFQDGDAYSASDSRMLCESEPLTHRDHLMVSFEDKDATFFYLPMKDYVGEYARQYDIAVLRSFYNMAASRMKPTRAENLTRMSQNVMKKWIEFAEIYYFRKRGVEPYFILFDRWFEDYYYRRELEEFFGWKETDGDMDFVPPKGGGSSFDGRSLPGTQLQVNDRWRRVEFPDYILKSDRARVLNRLIFGWTLDRNGNYVE